MKNKYVSYNDVYKDYSQYVDINDYLSQYNGFTWSEYKTETEDEKVLRYERVIEKLKKMLEHERRLLKGARS